MEHKGIRVPDWLEAMAGDPDFPRMLEIWEGTAEYQVAQLGRAFKELIDELTALFEKNLGTRILYRLIRWYSRMVYKLNKRRGR